MGPQGQAPDRPPAQGQGHSLHAAKVPGGGGAPLTGSSGRRRTAGQDPWGQRGRTVTGGGATPAPHHTHRGRSGGPVAPGPERGGPPGRPRAPHLCAPATRGARLDPELTASGGGKPWTAAPAPSPACPELSGDQAPNATLPAPPNQVGVGAAASPRAGGELMVPPGPPGGRGEDLARTPAHPRVHTHGCTPTSAHPRGQRQTEARAGPPPPRRPLIQPTPSLLTLPDP